MQVLTRKPNESVLIGSVTLKVLEVRGHEVRLGNDAPEEVDIRRPELNEFWLEADENSSLDLAVSSA